MHRSHVARAAVAALLWVTACRDAGAPLDTGIGRRGLVFVSNRRAGTMSIVDLSTDRVRSLVLGEGPSQVAISADGSVAAVTLYGSPDYAGNALVVVDPRAARVVRTVNLGEYMRPRGVRFLGTDRSRVVLTSEDSHRLVVLNLENGRVEAALPTGGERPYHVEVSADGRQAWSANLVNGTVTEFDMRVAQAVRTFVVAPRTGVVTSTPDGTALWTASTGRAPISVVDARSGGVVGTIGDFTQIYDVAIAKRGHLALATDPVTDRLHVFDVPSQREVWQLGGLGSPRGAAVDSAGRVAVVATVGDNTIAIIDLVARRVVRRIEVGESPHDVRWIEVTP